jgi:hypothetical protein
MFTDKIYIVYYHLTWNTCLYTIFLYNYHWNKRIGCHFCLKEYLFVYYFLYFLYTIFCIFCIQLPLKQKNRLSFLFKGYLYIFLVWKTQTKKLLFKVNLCLYTCSNHTYVVCILIVFRMAWFLLYFVRLHTMSVIYPSICVFCVYKQYTLITSLHVIFVPFPTS